MMHDRLLTDWAKETKAKLPEAIQHLIPNAKFDLWHGPFSADDGDWKDWPGFQTACEQIKQAIDELGLPGTLYIDTGCGYWTDTEPSDMEDCYQCNGSAHDCDDESDCDDDECCSVCDGACEVFADNSDWVSVDRRQLIVALVGQELAEYIR